jgi:hypothetical protein
VGAVQVLVVVQELEPPDEGLLAAADELGQVGGAQEPVLVDVPQDC